MSQFERIWIDAQYPSDVLFFNPIIKELLKRGHAVQVSARDAFETCDLLELKGYKYSNIGKYPGKKIIKKIYGTILRAVQLAKYSSNREFSIALSFGSPSQILASFILKMKCVCISDYEHASTFPWRYMYNKIIMPEYINNSTLTENGIDLKKVTKFPGLKEDLYKNDFEPDPTILGELGIEMDKIIVSIRPPATSAHYHNPESENLLFKILDYLVRIKDLNIVLLARKEQKEIISKAKKKFSNKIIFPRKALNGLNLIYHSDLVISGGGTMNREAAVLKVPAYSIFRGKAGAVDTYLEKKQKLRFISTIEDINKIKIKKRKIIWPLPDNTSLIRLITDQILYQNN
jgi:predicted glycosyltransferase